MRIAIICLFALLFSTEGLMAQASKVVACSNYLEYYRQGEGAENIQKALDAITEATADEKTGVMGKTWYYRGQVYVTIGNDPEVLAKYQDVDINKMAFESFKTAMELNDPKFRDSKNLFNYTKAVASNTFNAGVDQYEQKQYAKSYETFMRCVDINQFLLSHEQDIVISTKKIMDNAAMSAQQAGMYEEAVNIYQKKLGSEEETAQTFRLLSFMYSKIGRDDDARRMVMEGVKKYPDNIDLMIDELNIFLGEGRIQDAIGKIEKAIAVDPSNGQLHYVLGTAHDKNGDFANATKAYEKAVEVDPNNYNAAYNLGALYFNQANPLIEEMNKLGMSSTDQKRYEELNQQRIELYRQAKPSFELALKIKPEDEACMRALKKIEGAVSVD